MNLIRIEVSMTLKLKVKVLSSQVKDDGLAIDVKQMLATQKCYFLHATVLFQGEEAQRNRSCKEFLHFAEPLKTKSSFFTVRGTYLLLTKYKGRTVSYERVFLHRFMAKVRSVRAINRRGKRGSVTYSTDRKAEVSKIFIISLLCV